MQLNSIFLAFALVVGGAVGGAYVAYPPFRAINLPPYFIVLIALAVFDVVCHLRGGGAPGTMITMSVRFAGFFLALAVLFAITWAAGLQIAFF